MDTRHLRGFLRTADLRSISRAAESLGLAQPSLSQQLLRLEDEVGFKLFNRTARGVTVTEAGRIFQEHARQILHSIDQAREDSMKVDAAAHGQAILALPPSINRLIGLRLVETAITQAPTLSVRLVEALTGPIRGWLNTAQIDFGMLYDLGPMRHLSSRPLATEELFLVGPAGHFGDDPDAMPEIPLSSLPDYPLITLGAQHGLRRIFEHESHRLGFSYRVQHEIDALDTITALVENARGFTILSRPGIERLVTVGRLSMARLEGGAIKRTLCLVRNPARTVTHASTYIEDQTIKIMTDLIAAGTWQAQPEAALL